jgi:hypothetical protein
MPSQRDWYRLNLLSYNGPQALAMLKLVRIDKTFPEMAKLSALDREAFPPRRIHFTGRIDQDGRRR